MTTTQSTLTVADREQWLARLGGSLQAGLNQYDYDHGNRLVRQHGVPLTGETVTATLADSIWTITTQVVTVPTRPDARDFTITFHCQAGRLSAAAVTVSLALAQWSASNYVLLPAAAYNGNRFLARKIPYSPKLYYVQDIGPDVPMIITDVPRLNIGPGPSRIQERSGSLATPAMGFQAAATGRGLLLLTTQGNEAGDYGLGIEENRGRDRATLTLTSPVVRELHNYRICDLEYPSLDQPRDFVAGDTVTFHFRLFEFAARTRQSLFDHFAAVRKDFAGERLGKARLPYSACLELQEAKFNQLNFVPEHGYYSVGPRQNFLQDWQIGWTGGMISTYPLLFAGSAATRENVQRNFDWLFPKGISPSGFFWDSGRNGTEWIGGDIRKPHTGHWHLIRKSGDAVFFIIKQLRLMEQQGLPVKPAWRDGVRTVCDAFVKLWERSHQFGQFVHALTGEICVGGSTSGAIIPAALMLAADYFCAPGYRAVAVAAGEKYYQEFTVQGLSCGGPGDAVQNPDSESWYALIESYMALYEATGEAVWLARAGETARQFSTWVVSYDFEFPPVSTFARAGIHSTGSVYANTQNKHSAPGLCTFAGLGLLKLFRATGDRFYLELLRDIAFGLPQYLPHPVHPIGDATFGHMCERVNLTDWEGPERIGETLKLTTWAETSLMLTAVEIPGLYVQPDRGLVVAFDNIVATVVKETLETLEVRLCNPTAASATVTVWVESRSATRQPLPENYLFGCRTETLPPGANQTLTFKKTEPNSDHGHS